MLVNLAAIGVIYVVWKFIKWEAEQEEYNDNPYE